MRRLATVGVVGLAIGVAGVAGASGESAPAAPVPSAPVPKQGPSNIAVLVAQLGAEHFSDREAAAAAIEKLGPAAFDALRAGTRSDSPEIRERATTLLTKLERRVSSASRLTAKRVKLDYQDMPLGAALNDLKARTGLNFVLDPERVANPLRKITCQTTDLPAWEAVEAFCQAAGLQEEFRQELDVPKPSTSRRGYMPPPSPPNADAVPITLIDGKHERLPGSRSSAVRVLVLPHTFPGHRVTLGTGETTLAFDVAPAPGLGWVEVTGVKITRVIDSNDRAGSAGVDKNTSPDEEFNGMMFGRGPGIAMRFDINGNSIMPTSLANPRIVSVPLKLATATATSLKRLEGVVFGDIQLANQHLITVENPKQHLATSFDGPQELKFGVLELKDPPGPGGLGTIKVQLEFPSDFGLNVRRRGFNGFGWPQPPRMGQGYRVEAFDATGKPFPLSSNGFSGISNDGMTMRQEFTMTFRPGQGTPAKLVVVGPKTVTVEVPFALENVPLP